MLLLLLLQLFLIIDLFLRVIELSVDKVVLVRLPIFIHHLQALLHSFSVYFFLVVLFVLSCYDVELFFVAVNQILLSLNGDFYLPAFEVEVRQFLIIYDIVSVADRS